MDVTELLTRTACFRGIEKRRIEELMSEGHVRFFQRNEVLWRQGARTRYLAFIIQGRVKLVLEHRAGKELIVDMLGPGRIIDTIPTDSDALMTGIVGLAQGAVVLLDRQVFLERLERCGPVAVNVLRQFSRDQHELVSRLREVSGDAIEARLAALFLRLAGEEGTVTPEGVALRIPLSRQDLAALTDSTVETAVRVMSRWNRDGTLLTRRDGFLIPDANALAQCFH